MSKESIVEAFREQNPRKRFNQLLQLLMKHPNCPSSTSRYLNVSGYSKENLDMLEYDIKKLYGISNSVIHLYSKPEEKVEESTLPDYDKMNYHELKKLANKKAKELEVDLSDQKKETLVSFLVEIAKEPETFDINPYLEAPDEAKEALKLRDEFPFLKEKDCPDEFKILVADKFTALAEFEKAHAEIQKVKETADAEKLFDLGKQAVENWELNREIYEELDYYKEHGEILGNHPIFEHDMLQLKVNKMSIQEVMKRQGNLRSYISRESKKLEEIKDEKKRANVETKLSDWQAELDLIDARLNEKKE